MKWNGNVRQVLTKMMPCTSFVVITNKCGGWLLQLEQINCVGWVIPGEFPGNFLVSFPTILPNPIDCSSGLAETKEHFYCFTYPMNECRRGRHHRPHSCCAATACNLTMVEDGCQYLRLLLLKLVPWPNFTSPPPP